jgi:hypothetical protein
MLALGSLLLTWEQIVCSSTNKIQGQAVFVAVDCSCVLNFKQSLLTVLCVDLNNTPSVVVHVASLTYLDRPEINNC